MDRRRALAIAAAAAATTMGAAAAITVNFGLLGFGAADPTPLGQLDAGRVATVAPAAVVAPASPTAPSSADSSAVEPSNAIDPVPGSASTSRYEGGDDHGDEGGDGHEHGRDEDD